MHAQTHTHMYNIVHTSETAIVDGICPQAAKTLFTLVFSVEFGTRCFAYGIYMFNWYNSASWLTNHHENPKEMGSY